MFDIKKIRERAESLYREQEQALETHSRNNENPLKQESYTKRADEYASLMAQIAEFNKLESERSQFDHKSETRGARGGNATATDNELHSRSLIEHIKSNGKVEPEYLKRADLSTSGNYFVPVNINSALVQKLTPSITVRAAGAAVRPVKFGVTKAPYLTGSAAVWIAEGSSRTATDVTSAAVSFTPVLLVCNTSYTDEAQLTSPDDLQNMIVEEFSRQSAVAQNTAFLVGAGGGAEPKGVIKGVSATAASSSTSTITFAEVLGVLNGVNTSYRTGGKWFMSTSAQTIMYSLADDADNSVLIPNFSTGLNKMLGYDVVVDDAIDAMAANSKPLAFINVPYAYTIMESTVAIFVDGFTGAGSGKVKVFLKQYLDGQVTNSAAGKALLTKAS